MTSSSARSAALLWLKVFGLGIGVVTGLLLWTVLTPPFRGDLTRLGRLSETDFGPTLAVRPIDPALRVSSPLKDADVLVIGDSFSAPLLWQAELVARGLKVSTIDWKTIGQVCTDLGEVLRTQGFRGSTLVIESVERGLQTHLDESLACLRTRLGRLKVKSTPHDWNPEGPFGLNTHETLWTGLLTTLHTHRARQSEAAELVNQADGAAQVRIQRVPDGCQRFSHRQCERGLFLADDRNAPAFTPDSAKRLQQLVARHPNLSITWLVLPNKSSIYLQPEHAASVGTALEVAGLGPDLFGQLVRASRHTRDLYNPNDTHTSTEGYRLVGQALLGWRQARGDQPANLAATRSHTSAMTTSRADTP